MKTNQWILWLALLGTAQAQFVQQGDKLVPALPGDGGLGLGASAAISGDGNTVLFGGVQDVPDSGAWVFTRNGGAWTQQGSKLMGIRGVLVALSADGNTALVGDPESNGAWVFSRNSGVWTQPGTRLVGNGAIGSVGQGVSVALSADGNTALVGGSADNKLAGAAWVFTRTGNVWTQQGGKLAGSGAIGDSVGQGQSVALSADGNTALVGGPGDNSGIGAVWVFTRSGGSWTQQGSKLIGSGVVGAVAEQGFSVALSADGSTALVSGIADNYGLGSVWVFTRSGNVWTQQGSKLVASEETGLGQEGLSVALSADGNTAIVSSLATNGALVFKRSGGIWSQRGKLVGNGQVVGSTSVAISANGRTAVEGYSGAAWVFAVPPVSDFNGDGLSDVLLYDYLSGTAYTALSNGDGTFRYVYNLFTPEFDIVHSGDFNGDGKSDLVLYNPRTGLGYIGMSNGDGTFDFQSLFWSPGYYGVYACDINGDGKTDFILIGQNMVTAISDGFGGFTYKSQYIGNWGLTEVADFTGDGKADLFVYDYDSGAAYVGVGDGTGEFTFHPMSISPEYSRFAVGDLNGDGKMDILLYNIVTGAAASGISDGAGGFTFTPLLFSRGFTRVILADFTGDGKADVALYETGLDPTGLSYFGTGNGDGTFSARSLFWSPGYWSLVPQDVNGDGKADILLLSPCPPTIAYAGLSNGDGTFNYTYLRLGDLATTF